MLSALGIYTVQTPVAGLLLMVMLGIFYAEAREEAETA